MNISLRRALTNSSTIAFLGLILSASTGCSLLSAAGNPKVAWAVTDPAPLSVVVRRADAAMLTTKEVDRLLTATPTGVDSDWMLKVGPDPKVAAGEMKALSQDPMYLQSHARVVASEVWIRTLPEVQSAGGDHPNLLAAIDPSLGDAYSVIMAKKQEIAGYAATAEDESTAADAKDVSPEDKKAHQEAAKKAKEAQAKAEAEVDPLAKKFIASLKETASKVPVESQAKFAPAIANLLQAIDDADIANGAAAVRYPIALRSMTDSLKAVAPTIVADIIEEKTGVRPSLAKLNVGVTLSGSTVSLTIAGLGPAELGALSIADVTKEAIKREGAWFVHAVTLLGTVASTKETLNFEHDVLAGIQAGFAPPPSSGPAALVVIKIPAADSPTVMAAVPAVHLSAAAKAKVAVAINTSATIDVKADAKADAKGAPGKKKPVAPATKAPAGKAPAKTKAPTAATH